MDVVTARAHALSAARERLGEDVTFTPAGGQPVTVRGIFRAPVSGGEARRGAGRAVQPLVVEGQSPRVSVVESEATEITEGMVLTIRGEPWDVVRLRPNRQGRVDIVLAAAQPTDPATGDWR